MLPRYKIELVRRLLHADKLSRRCVAKSARVSRGSVKIIASEPAPEADDLPFIPSGVPDEESIVPTAPPCRCGTCGGWVYPPCLACEIRALLEKQWFPHCFRRRRRPFVVGLDLIPRHFVRYLQVRRYRRALEGDIEDQRAAQHQMPTTTLKPRKRRRA